MRRKVIRPGNTSVKKLLSDRRFVETVLKFLECTGVRKVEQGVVSFCPFPSFPFLSRFFPFVAFHLFLYEGGAEVGDLAAHIRRRASCLSSVPLFFPFLSSAGAAISFA